MVQSVLVSMCLIGVAMVHDEQRSNGRRPILDVLVFYADPPRDTEQYPPEVRRELRRFVQRFHAYRPRPRRAQLGPLMEMVYNSREGYEGKLTAAAISDDAASLARDYVDRLKPCYEWEGFHDCPEREALFAEQYLTDHPDTPFREFLRVLAAHRWLCAAEGYEHERNSQGRERSRRRYEDALAVASQVRSTFMRAAANELKANGRCYAVDPFRRQ